MARAFGPYLVEQELARGGMGVVYAVRHRETGVRYALKTVLAAGSGDELLRFRREADLMSRLDHPGIVKVHSAGVENGIPYLVQSFLAGGSLQERLRERRRLPRGEAVALVADLADAVAYAHEHEVLHRDLKPHNVLFDEQGRAVLVDFGLGRDLAAESRRLTETGQVMGTPGYMAPEQVEGERRDDPRTDVYGLGAILFALLTGQPPFTGRGLGILAKIVHDSAPDLSAIEPETPPALAATVARCLAKRPGDRFPSAADLARVLRSGERPASPRGGGLSVAAGVVGALVLAVLFVASAGRPPPAAAPAPQPANDTRRTPRSKAKTAKSTVWNEALAHARPDPLKAWRVLERLEGPPPEGFVESMLGQVGRHLGAFSKRAKTEGIGRGFTNEDRARWLACLRIFRRLRPKEDLPPTHVQSLENVIPLRFDQASDEFVRAVVKVLGKQHVPAVAQSVLYRTRRLPQHAREAWVDACRLLADGFPERDVARWTRAQVAVIDLLDGLSPLSLAPPGAERRRAEDLLRRVDLLYARADLGSPFDARLVARAGAKACLRLGDRRAAHFARNGWTNLRDVVCRGLAAFARRDAGKPEEAVAKALQFLADNREKRGVVYTQLVGLIWDLRGAHAKWVEVERELRLLIEPKAARLQGWKEKQADFHGHRLRLVLLLLEGGRKKKARGVLRTLRALVKDHLAWRGKLWCGCKAEEHRVILSLRVRGPMHLARLRRLVATFDERRRDSLNGRP